MWLLGGVPFSKSIPAIRWTPHIFSFFNVYSLQTPLELNHGYSHFVGYINRARLSTRFLIWFLVLFSTGWPNRGVTRIFFTNIHIYIYDHIHIYIYDHIYIYIHTYIYTHTHVENTHTHMYIYIYIHIKTKTYFKLHLANDEQPNLRHTFYATFLPESLWIDVNTNMIGFYHSCKYHS